MKKFSQIMSTILFILAFGNALYAQVRFDTLIRERVTEAEIFYTSSGHIFDPSAIAEFGTSYRNNSLVRELGFLAFDTDLPVLERVSHAILLELALASNLAKWDQRPAINAADIRTSQEIFRGKYPGYSPWAIEEFKELEGGKNSRPVCPDVFMDFSQLEWCGNNRTDTGEACDGRDVPGNCEDFGLTGNLKCRSDCGYDFSECVGPAVCETPTNKNPPSTPPPAGPSPPPPVDPNPSTEPQDPPLCDEDPACFEFNGVFYKPIEDAPQMRLTTTPPIGQYSAVHITFTVKAGKWEFGRRVRGNIVWFSDAGNFRLYGNILFVGKKLRLAHGIDVPAREKVGEEGAFIMIENETYDFDYMYNASEGFIRLTVSSEGEELFVLNSVPNVSVITVRPGKDFWSDLSFSGQNDSERPTFGWEYSKYTVRFIK